MVELFLTSYHILEQLREAYPVPIKKEHLETKVFEKNKRITLEVIAEQKTYIKKLSRKDPKHPALKSLKSDLKSFKPNIDREYKSAIYALKTDKLIYETPDNTALGITDGGVLFYKALQKILRSPL